MATVTLKGNLIKVSGDLPPVGEQAPDFQLTGPDLTEVNLAHFAGKKLILNIYPSVDTSTCATSTREFNNALNVRDDVVVVCVSQDLPFAFSRFCAAEGLENIKTASSFRSPKFLTDYGLRIEDGPLAGLCARAVVVVDEFGKVIYTELVAEIADEPNYDAAMKSVG